MKIDFAIAIPSTNMISSFSCRKASNHPCIDCLGCHFLLMEILNPVRLKDEDKIILIQLELLDTEYELI